MSHKIPIIALLISLLHFTASAQETIWNDGFETEPTAWQFIDNDGDGRNWTISNTNPHDGTQCLYGNYSPTAEDNWAVSPAIQLPDNGNMITVEWQVFGHSNYVESYEFLITTAEGDNLEAYIPLLNESISGGYFARQVDITGYAGQTIHIAFRHLSQNQNFICIDDVTIKRYEQLPPQPPIVEIACPNNATVGETVTLSARCDNANHFLWNIEGTRPSNPEGRTTTAKWNTEGRYRISLTATNADGSTTADHIISILPKNSLTETPDDYLSPLLYPNPAKEMICIDMKSVTEVRIIDAAGRVLICSDSTKTKIAELPDGVYTAIIVTTDGIISKSFIKKH